tara:strand:+ start:1187 stop:1432 length:246 start_codon:yes stop_codon:yes gene_type:complete
MNTLEQNTDFEMSFDLLFENNNTNNYCNYDYNIPPSNLPPNNKKGKTFISPQLKWIDFNTETPPQFYLNQKFDFKQCHKKK